MKKRNWEILIILGLVLIAVLIYFVFFYKFPSPPAADLTPSAPTGESANTGKAPSAETKVNSASPLKKQSIDQNDLARMAAAFAERFGSFSNQSDYGNVRDLQIFETAGMQAWSQNYISEAKAKKADTANYYGIITKSIVSQVKQFDSSAGQAEILVKTQRRESTGSSASSPAYYQDIIIKYKFDGGVWKVDSADWQSK